MKTLKSMKVMRMIFVIGLIFLLASCGEIKPSGDISIEILQAPQNVSINNGILSWDEVEGAVSYKVIVNDIEYITTNTYYNFSTVDTINIYVISINENGQSDKAGIIYAEKW